MNTTWNDPFADVDDGRFMVFVPAVMSVGLVFSAVTLAKDLLRRSGGRARRRRTRLEAGSAVAVVLGLDRPKPGDLGVLGRPSYLFSAFVLIGAAAYVSIGSAANFLREGGPVRDIGWLLAISLVLAFLLGFLGAVAASTFRTWPHPSPWTLAPLRRAPLSITPGTAGAGPPWGVTVALGVTALVLLLLVLMVGTGRSVAMEIDEPVSAWLREIAWLDRLDFIDLFGSTAISIVFVAVVGLAGMRCRVLGFLFPAVFVTSWFVSHLLQRTVARPRPLDPIGDLRSFPSGHMVQAVFIAGLVPLAVYVLSGDRRVERFLRVILSVFAVLTGLDRLHEASHWPIDVLAGATLGLLAVLISHWVVEHAPWHQHCTACAWSGGAGMSVLDRPLFDVGPRASRTLRIAGAGLAVGIGVLLFIGVDLVGLPEDPEGYGLGSEISAPTQLGLALVVVVAGAFGLRWPIIAASALALAAVGIGLFATIEYAPRVAVVLSAAIAVPAVVLWLSWQTHETIGTIAAVAMLATSALGTVAVGGSMISDHYFGPTHPESLLPRSAPAAADWLWLGGVTQHEATVAAGGLESGERYQLVVTGPDGTRSSSVLPADAWGVVKLTVDGLTSARLHDYWVVRAGDGPPTQPDGSFRTMGGADHDLVVAFGSCARVGTNGAVFEMISRQEPDLFIAVGDLHYANLASDDPADHVAAYSRLLSEPAPAMLMRSVPTAYVWDDHDYGPNDADASSPSRLAVGTAYRSAVPDYGVSIDVDEPINQAFTVSDVRFVLTDTRSQRSAESMLGSRQREWLIDEIVAASEVHRLVVWVNPTPWITVASPGVDDWGAYADDRVEISRALADAGVDNLVMVSGDAHMVAIDDGSNSGFVEGWGVPVLHAAALDRPGSLKGGPYSEGAVAGGGQYGELRVSEHDGLTEVRLIGRRWDGAILVEYSFQIG